MRLALKVYTDETLTEVKRVAEADKVKIPYRVAMYIISSLESVDIKNNEDLIKFVGCSADKLDKVVKATFRVSEQELDCVDAADLIPVGVDLYKWALEKISELKGNNSKNAVEAV